jgi:hypothetical protein
LKEDTLVPTAPSGSGGSPTPKGADTENITFRTTPEGTWVRPFNSDAQLNVTIHENRTYKATPEGPSVYLAQAQIFTSRFTNIRVGERGATALGRTFEAGWRLDRTQVDGADTSAAPTDKLTFTSLKENTSFSIDGTDIKVTAVTKGAEHEIVNGQYQNSLKAENFIIQKGDVRIYFNRSTDPKHADSVVPSIDVKENLSFDLMGKKVGLSDIIGKTNGPITGVLKGQLVDGKILFNLNSAISLEGVDAVNIQNHAGVEVGVNARDVSIVQIGIDVATGGTAATASFGMKKDDSFTVAVPKTNETAQKEGEVKGTPLPSILSKDMAKKVATTGVQLDNVIKDGKVVGTKATAVRDGARVNAVVTVKEVDGKKSLSAQPNLVTSYGDFTFGPNGFNAVALGKNFKGSDKGGDGVTIGDLAKGNYKLTLKDNSSYQDTKEGLSVSVKKGGELWFQGGIPVLKATQSKDEAPTVFTAGGSDEWAPKSHTGTLVVTAIPKHLDSKDLRAENEMPAVLTVVDGEATLDNAQQGTTYRQTSREALKLTNKEGTQSFEIAPNSVVRYTGLESFSPANAFVVDRGSVRYHLGSTTAEGAQYDSQILFERNGTHAVTQKIPLIGGKPTGVPLLFIQESRQVRGNGDVTRARWGMTDNGTPGFRIDNMDGTASNYDSFDFMGQTIQLGARGQVVYSDQDLYNRTGREGTTLVLDGG